jgi:hypothetical protein
VDEGIDTGKILYQAAFANRGIKNCEAMLKDYRFAQDAMAIQCLRDLSYGKGGANAPVLEKGVFFFPGVDADILEILNLE